MLISDTCLSRLKKEFRDLKKNPVPGIRACPNEANILEWHYVLDGPTDTPYYGGFYHGILTFPAEYPYKPPSIQMITPNGRFKVHTRLCLSMSDFHPESWNPVWSVGTVLMGLYSFMSESTPTSGSIDTSLEEKRRLARSSLEFNCRNRMFCELFPDLLEYFNSPEYINRADEMAKSSQRLRPSSTSSELSSKANERNGSSLNFFFVIFSICLCLFVIFKLTM